MKPKLTQKQSLFCMEYIIDFNASRAALVAGYSKKTAPFTGYENLKKPQIQAQIQKNIKKRVYRIERTADEVVERLWKFSDIDEQQYDAQKSQNTKSTELLAKHYGLLIEKKEITGKDGKELFPVLSDQDRKVLADINAK